MTPAVRICVAVASDQSLVADVIAAALCDHGFTCSVMEWPAEQDGDIDGWETALTLDEATRPDAALMISDFERVTRIRGAVQLLLEVPVSWVVLTAVPRGPLWGALLEIGSNHVAPASTGLEEVTELLLAAAHGENVTSEKERSELVGLWSAVLAEHEDVRTRLATMTPRESQVLRLLYAGSPVRSIAKELDVAEATVRTQVKRVLRKLEVRSQLAAVAALEQVRRSESCPEGTDALASTMWLGRHFPEMFQPPA